MFPNIILGFEEESDTLTTLKQHLDEPLNCHGKDMDQVLANGISTDAYFMVGMDMVTRVLFLCCMVIYDCNIHLYFWPKK